MRSLLCLLALTFGTMTACAAEPATAAATTFQPAQLRDFPRDQLAIERRGGRDHFQIWLATNSAHQQQGLMWIRQLPADAGMLFVLGAPREMTMWMKNTYVSLDMLFINSAGRISHIAARTTPLSEKIISSNGEVTAVLEIAGGEAQRRGITIGDRVAHPALSGNR